MDQRQQLPILHMLIPQKEFIMFGLSLQIMEVAVIVLLKLYKYYIQQQRLLLIVPTNV